VRAAGARPRPCSCSISSPSPRQGRRLQGDRQKASCVLHRLVTSCGKHGDPGCRRRGFGRVEAGSGSPVEGTSGSACPALLRGRAGRAALGGIGPPALESPPSAATVSRREVSERIGSGSSSDVARYRLRPARPLIRETSASGCRRHGARRRCPCPVQGRRREARLRPRLSRRPFMDGAGISRSAVVLTD